MRTKLPLLLIVIFSISFAQKSNPLFQVMSANSMLERPEVFRKLQISVEESLGDVEYGLAVKILTKEIEEKKKLFKSYLDNLKVEITKSQEGVFQLWVEFPAIDKIKFKLPSQELKIDAILSKIEDSLAVPINELIYTTLIKSTFLDEKEKAIIWALVNSLKQEGIFDNSIDFEEKEISYQLAKKISGLAVSELKKLIDKNLLEKGLKIPKKLSLGMEVKPDSINGCKYDKLYQLINCNFNTSLNQVKQLFIEIIDKVEFVISNTVDDISKYLISGNVGISVSKGEGDFSGGIHYLLKVDENIQVGAYVNPEFTSMIDTTKIDSSVNNVENELTAFLFGLQVRFIINDDVEFNGLLSRISGSDIKPSMEGCASLSFRPIKEIILGLSYFYSQNSYLGMEDGDESHILGLNISSSSPGSPSLLVGFLRQRKLHLENDGNYKFGEYGTSFVFQVGYPITF